ncbi:MAG: hypothetical protein H6901_04000 [Rhodobacteraceae bacterium]|nr:hypothetical protein [Paracoccaceae bacterium]
MVVAFPATKGLVDEIRGKSLFHVSASRFRNDIIKNTKNSHLPNHANCEISLKPGQGWSVAPFRLLRDYSIMDPYLNHIKAWGKYTYFFIGEPGWWAVKKNIGPGARWGNLGPDTTVYEILGRDLVKNASLLFYRPDDKVLVIRGGYDGFAFAEPAP